MSDPTAAELRADLARLNERARLRAIFAPRVVAAMTSERRVQLIVFACQRLNIAPAEWSADGS